jgi:hypothetical protein
VLRSPRGGKGFAAAAALPLLVLPALTAPLSVPTSSPTPGWRLVSSDDFTGSALGPRWGAYGGVYGIGANAWSPDDVSVSGGALHIKMERRATAGKPFTSGGAAMWGFAQTYGRYEFRAQAPTTAGIDSYITLWPPVSDSDAEATLVELLAKPAVAPGQEAAYVTIGYGGGKNYATVPGHYTGGFHDYVIEWTPDHETVSVDGAVLLRSTQVTKVRRWIGFIMSDGDALTGTPGPSAALPAEFLIENLRVYAYAPGGGTPVSTSTTSRSTPRSTPTSASASAPAKPSPLTTSPISGPGTTPAPIPTPTATTPAAAQSSDQAASRPTASTKRSFGAFPIVAAAMVLTLAAAGLILRRRRSRP